LKNQNYNRNKSACRNLCWKAAAGAREPFINQRKNALIPDKNHIEFSDPG
jgi:hypothetical protein